MNANDRYVIHSAGSTAGLVNPLRGLDGETFASREEAVDRIYRAMYDVINGDDGCEMVERPDLDGLDDDAYIAAIERYDNAVREYIAENGYAREDGWTAVIEVVA